MTLMISVCIPTFNGESFLRDTLNSVQKQSHKDFEALIVDDNSTDATIDICADFARADPRFRIERNPQNLGLVGNWARCIDLARGAWIKFVFQDDLLDPSCIAELLREGERADNHLVFCRRRYVFEEGTLPSLRQYYLDHLRLTEERFPTSGSVTPETFASMVLASPTTDANFIGEPIAVMFRKSMLQQFGSFNPVLAVSCDTEFWQRLGVNVGAAHVATELATFRVHRGATTSTHLRERHFRMNVLDPVVVLHEQAFHPAFEPLRRFARQQGKDVGEMFREKAAWAFNSARALSAAASGSNKIPLEEWRLLAARLPRLAAIESSAATRPGLLSRATFRARRLLTGS